MKIQVCRKQAETSQMSVTCVRNDDLRPAHVRARMTLERSRSGAAHEISPARSVQEQFVRGCGCGAGAYSMTLSIARTSMTKLQKARDLAIRR